MNSKALFAVAAFAAFASAAARADDITIDPTPFQSARTRAEVQAELVQFKRSGVNPWATSYNQLAQFRSTRARTDVRVRNMTCVEHSGFESELAVPVRRHGGKFLSEYFDQ